MQIIHSTKYIFHKHLHLVERFQKCVVSTSYIVYVFHVHYIIQCYWNISGAACIVTNIHNVIGVVDAHRYGYTCATRSVIHILCLPPHDAPHARGWIVGGHLLNNLWIEHKSERRISRAKVQTKELEIAG